ncbi:MAG: hypothetical protein ABS62_08435 [Microbacterium sp. SCN 70-200]|uniref:SRPBCC family protein n=1 Tax=unclassified Microbacterium TaxID=2609290 RepID=UPI00086B5145|nr:MULTISPECIES: SRPBCC family protein [unclassified Microbacterium]MBN9214345.1 SRPBCC family protein [Microbacterium sp.]ODT40984.1 MAG: hypothetical protein ABS62_08435 [Microbacterium sp. SCN 70-200]OJV83845.1 MAG: hypothetical protein BGO46_12685 [Microbacterium sp. 70-16]
MRHAYAFTSRWHIAATREQCWAGLADALHTGPISWWPAVRVATAPAEITPGAVVVLEVRSPLGYRLRVRLTIVAVDPPTRLEATSSGDLAGIGILTLTDVPGATTLTWTWQVEVRRRWMRATGAVLRPAFAAAHRAVMRRGEQGFAAYVAAAAPA